MRDLKRSLRQHDLAFLRVIAENWGADLIGLSQREAAEHLANAVLAADLPAEAADLPPDEQAGLQSLIDADGRMLADPFFRQFGSIRPTGPGRLERERPWAHPSSPAEALWYRGLLFRAFEQTELGTQEFVYLPDDVRDMFPTRAATVRPELSPTGRIIARWVSTTGLTDDCCTLLACLHRNPYLSAAEDQILRYMSYKDRARLGMIWAIALDAGLLEADGDMVRPHPLAASEWLSSSYPDQASALALTWLDSTRWNDLRNVPSLRLEHTGWQNDPCPPRQLLLDILSGLDPATWWELDSLPAAVKATIPDFQRTSGEYDSWYLRDAGTDEYLLGFQHWDRVEGALLRFLATGPFYWLGLVELGEDADGVAVAFRPTAAGSAFAEVRSFPFPPGPAQVRIGVRADATIVVSAATDRLTRFQVARLTDWEPLVAGSAAPSYRYRLTPRSLSRAKQAGISLSRALAFLASKSGHPLPESVTAAVASWKSQGAQVRLRQVTLLQVRTAAVLDQLRAASQVRPLLGETIGPLTIAVRTADWPRLVNALAESGLLCELEEDDLAVPLDPTEASPGFAYD